MECPYCKEEMMEGYIYIVGNLICVGHHQKKIVMLLLTIQMKNRFY